MIKKKRRKQIVFRTMKEYRDHYFSKKDVQDTASEDEYYSLGALCASLAIEKVTTS